MCSSDIFLGLIAILFPPIAVWVKSGICSADSLINLALCCLGFIPGLLHAWYIIAKNPEESSYYETVPPDAEHGRVTYYYVSGQDQSAQGAPPQGDRGQWVPPQRGYGTVQGMGAGAGGSGGEGSAQVPPSYEQAIKGDNKQQT
ncbi:hypothetical protein G7Y79_00022g051950 [Physcia stellaris]|nr:hypothetical protein G7Y79_00022g051950 [Physcia stellaris]